MLGLTGEPLIYDDVEAWKYGPVIPSLYRRYKVFGNEPIKESGLNGNVKMADPERIRPLLEKMWELYGDFSGVNLSTMTHAKGTPWFNVRHFQDGKNCLGADIPNSTIQDYYAENAKNGKQAD